MAVICWERADIPAFHLCCFTLCRLNCLCSFSVCQCLGQDVEFDCVGPDHCLSSTLAFDDPLHLIVKKTHRKTSLNSQISICITNKNLILVSPRIFTLNHYSKVIRKVQGVPQSQTAAKPRHLAEEERTKTNTCKTNAREALHIDQLPPPQAR